MADFFVVKREHLDIPALYSPTDRYKYFYGINWRAALAFLFALIPAMPGLAYNVNPDVEIGGAIYIANMNWYYGICVAFVSYSVLSLIWPASQSLVKNMIEDMENTRPVTQEEKDDVSVVVAAKS